MVSVVAKVRVLDAAVGHALLSGRQLFWCQYLGTVHGNIKYRKTTYLPKPELKYSKNFIKLAHI